MSYPSAPSSPEETRRKARELHAAARVHEAIQLQRWLINDLAARGTPAAEDYIWLGVMLYTAQDFAGAAEAFGRGRQLDPKHPDASLNLGLSLILAGRLYEAIAPLKDAERETPECLNLLDGLADVYGKLGDLENARAYGERSLLLKERQAGPPRISAPLPDCVPPPLRSTGAKRNVIAFSLFGAQERYVRGALKNATIAPYLYPDWRCRFYCDDTVPADARAILAQLGADVKMMPRTRRPADALFWRFLVADDPEVQRFLVRDCDSVINIREEAAVRQWLASRCCFHVMRDSPSHTDLILAGMWGGVAGILPPLARLLEGFSYNLITESRKADQVFLGRVVWPLVKGSCLIHDSLYRVFGAQDFPAGYELPPGRHVGQNDAAVA